MNSRSYGKESSTQANENRLLKRYDTNQENQVWIYKNHGLFRGENR